MLVGSGSTVGTRTRSQFRQKNGEQKNDVWDRNHLFVFIFLSSIFLSFQIRLTELPFTQELANLLGYLGVD